MIDFDRVEASNLSRCALFLPGDVGRPKVEAAARALARLNPEVAVRTIAGDLFYDVGLGWYRRSDLVIGCLDSLAARSQVGLAATLAGVPYLDGGMWSLGGEVRCFLPGDGPCFDCTLGPEDYERAWERRSCSGFRQPAGETGAEATLASTAAIVGGLLVRSIAPWRLRPASRHGTCGWAGAVPAVAPRLRSRPSTSLAGSWWRRRFCGRGLTQMGQRSTLVASDRSID
ncbi:MAG: ThiF family adenylyltransferase [bacterium]|nr:ThiF family adenylyltransferase [bacterium]